MRRLRLALGLVATALVLALVAGALAALLVSRGWQRERLRASIEARLTQAAAGQLEGARVRLRALGGPLLPEFELRGLELEVDGATLLRVEALRVRLAPRRLWRERVLAIEALRADGVALVFDAERTSLVRPAQEPAAPVTLPFAVELARLEVPAARVEVAWRQDGEPSRVAGLLDGSLSALRVEADGGASWPREAALALALEPSSIAGRALRGASLSLALEGSRARLETASLESEFGRLLATGDADLAGWLDPAARAELALALRAEALDPGLVLGRPELAGALGGVADVRAVRAAGRPLEESEIEASLRLSASRIGAVRIAAGALEGRWRAGEWTLADASLEANFARLRASGTGDLDGARELTLDLEVSDLGAPAALFGYDAAGSASARGQVRGPWRSLSGELELVASRLRVAAVEVGELRARATGSGDGRYRIEPLVLDGPRLRAAADGPLQLRWTDGGVRIDQARLRTPEGDAVELSGEITPRAAKALRVAARDLAVERVAAALGIVDAPDGALDLELVADGRWPRPTLRGALAWRAGPKLREVVESIRLELSTRAGALHASGAIAAQGRDVLAAELSAPWRPDVALSELATRRETALELRGDSLDLALLQPFLPDELRRAQGRAHVRISLRGGEPEPELDGELEIVDGFVYAVPLGRKLGPIAGRARLARGSLALEALRVGAGEIGVARAEGEILLDELRPAGVDVRILLEKFPMRVNDVLRARLDGTVELVGAFEALSASGAIALNELRYTLVRQPDPLLAEIRVHDGGAPSPPPPAAAESALLAGASVDLRLAVPAGEVSGQGARIAIAGELHAHKSPERPLRLSGRIDALEGSYRLRGKTFVLEDGRATFTGRADFDPELDALALHRVRAVKILARITGRASSPVLRLESDPPYPEGDVLALLLFGRTRDELGQSQTGALQGALGGTAGGAALGELIGAPLPIDAFEVETPDSGAPTIGVGRYVTDEVYVRYGQGFGAAGESEVRVEWRLAPRWNVQSSVSSSGSSSVDLIWTYDY